MECGHSKIGCVLKMDDRQGLDRYSGYQEAISEKGLAPVACLAEGSEQCERAHICDTIGFWKGFNEAINSYLDGTTLQDLVSGVK